MKWNNTFKLRMETQKLMGTIVSNDFLNIMMYYPTINIVTCTSQIYIFLWFYICFVSFPIQCNLFFIFKIKVQIREIVSCKIVLHVWLHFIGTSCETESRFFILLIKRHNSNLNACFILLTRKTARYISTSTTYSSKLATVGWKRTSSTIVAKKAWNLVV